MLRSLIDIPLRPEVTPDPAGVSTARTGPEVEGSSASVLSAVALPKRSLFSRIAKGTALSLAAVGFSYESPQSKGALTDGNTPRQSYIDYAQPFLAQNGGPACSIVINFQDGTSITTSGTLGNGDTVLGGAHTLIPIGSTVPDLSKIVSMTVLTGPNYMNDPGQSIPVNLSTIKVAPGYDGTLATLDMFGAKLTSTVQGLGKFTFGAPQSATQILVGNDFYTTTSLGAAGAIRDGQFMAYNANMDRSGFLPLGASTTIMSATDFGSNNSGLTLNAKALNGGSSGPRLDSLSVFYTSGRVSSALITGINVAQSGDGDVFGETISVDMGGPGGAFAQSEVATPEPSSVGLGTLALMALLLRRKQRMPA